MLIKRITVCKMCLVVLVVAMPAWLYGLAPANNSTNEQAEGYPKAPVIDTGYQQRLQQQWLDSSPTIAKLHARINELEGRSQALRRIRFTGFFQVQQEWGGRDAVPTVGNRDNTNPDASMSRLGIRRGRLRFHYDDRLVSVLYHIDVNETRVAIRDAFVDVRDPWTQASHVRVGLFFRPFGTETNRPSIFREAPERAKFSGMLFPEYRDMGVNLVLRAPRGHVLSFLQLDAGLYSGNGIQREFDSKRDFIGRLSGTKPLGVVDVRLAGSYYYGFVYQGTANVYRLHNTIFVRDNSPANQGAYARRQYVGVDGELGINSPWGRLIVRPEVMWGEQPAAAGYRDASRSPNWSVAPQHDTYIRNFTGGLVYVVQHFRGTPFTGVLRYDWYDPNSQLEGNQIGAPGSNTGIADLAEHAYGLGLHWKLFNDHNLKLLGYYEWKRNEVSQYVPGFERQRSSDLFTLRLEYIF